MVAREGETGDAEAEEAVVYADMAEGLDLKGKDRAASRRTHCPFNTIQSTVCTGYSEKH